jgi:hypothetical protein
MPLPLVAILPFAVRIGLFAAAGYAAKRFVAARLHTGRTDQRAEDALDDLDEGLAVHKPKDRAADAQTNAAARFRRIIGFRGERYEVDAGMMARFRIRKTKE